MANDLTPFARDGVKRLSPAPALGYDAATALRSSGVTAN